MKRIILAALLIATPLSAQVPADSALEAQATLTLALPPGSIVLNDTTVNHDITLTIVNNPGVLTAEDREAIIAGVRKSGAEKVRRGYHWEARIALLIAGIGVYRYWKNGKAQFDITNDINLGDILVDVDVEAEGEGDDDGHGHGRKGRGKGHKPGG